MIAITVRGCDAKDCKDVLEYLRFNAHPMWVQAQVEPLQDTRGKYFLVLMADRSSVGISTAVKMLSIEHDPTGASRGFVRDPATKLFRKSDGTPLITTVYTRWAIERRRSRPRDQRFNDGKAVEDDVWKRMIADAANEIRGAHGAARISIHESVPSNG